MRIGVIGVLVASMAFGCETHTLNLRVMETADHAELRSSNDERIGSIDLEHTRRVASILVGESSGWESPWYGTPVAKQRIAFFSGERLLGSVGVGETFLTAGPAQELSKDVDARTLSQIREAVGLQR